VNTYFVNTWLVVPFQLLEPMDPARSRSALLFMVEN
jgi:hypothetical protein